MVKIALTLLLPGLAWLLCGGPNLSSNSAYQLIFAIVVFHLWVVIWNQQVFGWLGGDAYTYGGVTLGLNLLSCAYTLFAAMNVFHKLWLFQWVWGEEPIKMVSDLPKAFIGLACLGVLMTLLIPMLTSRRVAPLPKKSERREYETPGEGGI